MMGEGGGGETGEGRGEESRHVGGEGGGEGRQGR